MAPRLDYGAIPNGTDDSEKVPLTANSNRRQNPNLGTKCLLLAFVAAILCLICYKIFNSAIDDSENGGGYYGWIPDAELGLQGVHREEDSSPSFIWGNKTSGPLPTNSWYLVSLEI